MHESIRSALLHKVEDIHFGGPTMAPLLEAIEAHGEPAVRDAFPLGACQVPDGETPLAALERHAATAASAATWESLLWIAVHTLRVGFIAPETALPVYERFSNGWLRGKASLGYPLPAQPADYRTGLTVAVRKLHEVLPALSAAGARLEHVYDY